MLKVVIKIFALHFIIAAIYFSITYGELILLKSAEPIGLGIQQVLLSIIHFVVTLIVCVFLLLKAKDKKLAKQKLLLNIISVIVCVIFYAILDMKISDWVWHFK